MLSVPSPSRRTARRLAVGLAAGLFALPAAASAAPLIGEQYDRGDGVAGTSALADFTVAGTSLSEDGRYAFFSYTGASQSKSYKVLPSSAPRIGVYVRDLVDNRTVQLVSTGYESQWGVDATADGTKASFVTRAKLLPADTDALADLYVVDVATRAVQLVSTGATGEASGRITRDGTSFVWQEGDKILRKPVAGGATVTLAQPALTIDAVSGDGKVVAYRAVYGEDRPINFAREGRPTVTVPQGTGADTAYYVALSPDGKLAALLPFDRRNSRAVNVDTGVVSYASWRTTGYDKASNTFNLSNDGWLQALVTNGTKNAIVEANINTRAVRAIAADLTWGPNALTASGTFASTGSNHGFVVPTGATPLPGTLDPPSPFAYLYFDFGCRSTSLLYPARKASIYVNNTGIGALPAPTSAVVKIRDRTSGAIANQFTITSTTYQYPISPNSGNFIAEVSVKLADGRTVSGNYHMDSYARQDCFINGF